MTKDAALRVLFATDGEGPAGDAEHLMIDIGDRSTTEVLAACVNTFDMSLHVSEVLGLGHYSPDAGLRHAETLAEAAAARLEVAGFTTKSHVGDGDAAGHLLEMAHRDAIGLVVLGAGHSRWRETRVLGRTSGLLLHESPCSVLLVHAWAPDRERGGSSSGPTDPRGPSMPSAPSHPSRTRPAAGYWLRP